MSLILRRGKLIWETVDGPYLDSQMGDGRHTSAQWEMGEGDCEWKNGDIPKITLSPPMNSDPHFSNRFIESLHSTFEPRFSYEIVIVKKM